MPAPRPVPYGRTARRLEWNFLPPHLRTAIEKRCGSPVVEAASQGAGFTPGFASVLSCEDGSRHFVKAASVKAQKVFAGSYREEARKLAALPDETPAPHLLWTIDDDWMVLGIEYVEARIAERPWTDSDLNAALDAAEHVAEVLTPAPSTMALAPIAEEMGDWASLWERARLARPELGHHDEAGELAQAFAEIGAGQTVVHTDLRDDNVLITPEGGPHQGRALFCDWNWPTVGADWLDSLWLLIGPRGDGLDVDRVIAERPLLRDLPADHIDSALAVVAGYFLKVQDDPVPPTSPHIRQHQAWCAHVCWEWLAERRGW